MRPCRVTTLPLLPRRRRCDFVATCVVFCSGGLPQRRRDGCPVAPTRWVMHWHNKHPCNPNSVCRCISSAILLRAGAPGAACSQATSHMTGINCHIWFICLDSSRWHMTGICLYVPSIWQHVVSSDMTGIWRSYDYLCHIPVIYLSYICHITKSDIHGRMTWYDRYMPTIYL